MFRFRKLCGLAAVAIAAAASAGAEGWRPLGPPGFPVRAVTVDPSGPTTLYGLRDSSPTTVVRSDDLGNTWLSRSLPAGVLGSALIAVPSSGNLYLGTSGNGVLRSTDRGETWIPFNSGLSASFVSSFAATRAGTLYASTSVGVFKLPFAAPSWIFVGPPNSDSNGIFRLQVSEDGQTLYASNGNAFYRTHDGGGTWTVSSPPSRFVNALALDTTGILYASDADSVFKSVDGATTWTRLIGPISGASFQSLAIDPTNRQIVYAGAGPFSSVFRSTDGGSSWTVFEAGLPHVLVTDIEIAGDGRRVYIGTSDGVVGGPGIFVYEFGGPCVGTAMQLCLLGNRFRVTVSAVDPRTGRAGSGQTIPQGDRYGMFSLPSFTGDPTFPEVIVKMADLTAEPPPLGGAFWVFHTGLTDLQYTLTIVDLFNGATKTYQNDRSDPTHLCGGADTAAFKP